MKRFVTTTAGLLIMTLAFTVIAPRRAAADPMREFVMSCSYGVLAGTLVGAATLAFSDKPGDNLNKVARGASFGLYAGVLLGLYVVYGVPNQEEAAIRDQLGLENFKMRKAPRFLVAPVVTNRGLEGGEFRYDVVRF